MFILCCSTAFRALSYVFYHHIPFLIGLFCVFCLCALFIYLYGSIFLLISILCMLFFLVFLFFFFFKQKTAYEMRISDWSSDVCSSDLGLLLGPRSVHRAEEIHPVCHAGARQRRRPPLRGDGGLAERWRAFLAGTIPDDKKRALLPDLWSTL